MRRGVIIKHPQKDQRSAGLAGLAGLAGSAGFDDLAHQLELAARTVPVPAGSAEYLRRDLGTG